VSVRVLAVSDEVDEGLAAGLATGWLVDLIFACGDLPADYLAALINAIDVPMVFVPGNHDPDLSGYRQSRSGLVTLAGFPAAPQWPPGGALGLAARACGSRPHLAADGWARRYRAEQGRADHRLQCDGLAVA
jgi:hypothetical protein